MNLNLPEGRTQLRELIRTLGEKMRERGDAWLLKDCTTREDSWYNRHLKQLKKKAEAAQEDAEKTGETQEDTEKEKEAVKKEVSPVCWSSEIGPICGSIVFLQNCPGGMIKLQFFCSFTISCFFILSSLYVLKRDASDGEVNASSASTPASNVYNFSSAIWNVLTIMRSCEGIRE